jgi:plastocyanin
MIGTPARLVLSATLAVMGTGIFLREAPGNNIPVPITLAAAAQARGGTIKGRVRLTGKSPGNAVIRMGVDPMCGRMNAGKQVVNEQVVVSADGGLANAFVRLQGSFPRTTPPTQPVTIDQRACFYLPRVVGTQVGQTLQVRNSDPMLHNVHSLSNGTNGFNVGQPSAGMVYTFQLKQEEVMLRLKCDVHRWMTAYIGVVSHPYFAVSGTGGTFEIANVPVGTYTIQTWHERFGSLTRPVRVTAGATAIVDVPYTGEEKPPPTADARELIVPRSAVSSRLSAISQLSAENQ